MTHPPHPYMTHPTPPHPTPSWPTHSTLPHPFMTHPPHPTPPHPTPSWPTHPSPPLPTPSWPTHPTLPHPTPPLHDPPTLPHPTPPHPWYIFGPKGACFHGLLHYVSLSVANKITVLHHAQQYFKGIPTVDVQLIRGFVTRQTRIRRSCGDLQI